MTWENYFEVNKNKIVNFVMLCISIIFPTRIEIMQGRDSLYNKGNIFSFNLVITFL
jgi:hypothetical protein